MPAEVFAFSFDVGVLPYSVLKTSLSGVIVHRKVYGYNRNGIILFRYIYDSEMFAYDVTCPNPDCSANNHLLDFVEQGKTLVRCESCRQEYDLVTGAPTTTKTRYRLKPYQIEQKSDFSYRVSGQ